MGQAAPEERFDVVAVEGFEPLFETVPGTHTSTDQDTHSNTPAEGVTVTEVSDLLSGWTLKMAAEKLGVSANTIRKRIKDRELHACKVVGPNGPEWRITPPTATGTITTQATATEAATATNTPTMDALLKVIESQSKQIDTAGEQVKAATQVIMYQRLQLEDRDSQIKLLTDSQHKQGWSRFWSWFTGR
jgi:hypothetical protein